MDREVEGGCAVSEEGGEGVCGGGRLSFLVIVEGNSEEEEAVFALETITTEDPGRRCSRV